MTALKILIVICSLSAAFAGPTTGGGVAGSDRDTRRTPRTWAKARDGRSALPRRSLDQRLDLSDRRQGGNTFLPSLFSILISSPSPIQ